MESLSISSFVDSVDYSEYTTKQLLAIPLAILTLALVVLVGWYFVTGSPVLLGVDFAGGSGLRVQPTDQMENPRQQLSKAFSVEPDSIQRVPSDGSYVVTFRNSGDYQIQQAANEARQSGFKVLSSSTVSPSLGKEAQKTALIGFLVAFVGMSLLIFGLFRTFVPSVAVIISAFSDVVVPIAMMNLLGIRLTLGTVAALLLLVGYSVDSDMLLNDYVVRRRAQFGEAVYSAMDTGLTMTATSFVAMATMTVGATVLGIGLLRDIGLIITIGLAVDVMNTYLMNVGLLRYYRHKGSN